MDQETLANASSIASRPRSALRSLGRPGRLPLEILVQIFLLTLPQLDHPQAPQKKVLSLVCRFWNFVVDSTPTLWSRISIADSISYVRKSVSKSGGHPIDVGGVRLTPKDWFNATRDSDEAYCKFLNQVQPHARRWRHVALRAVHGQGFAPPVATFPSLQTIKLYSWERSVLDDEYLALLNHRHAPFLREVSLRSPRIVRWDLITLPPTLSKLEISDVFEDYASIVAWFPVIAACPNLAVFRLSDISPRSNVVNGDVSTADVAELRALQELHMHNVRSDLVIDLLTRFRLPGECAIFVRCWIAGSSPSTSFLTPAISSQEHFRHEGESRQLTVAFTRYHSRLIVADQRWRMQLSLDGAEAIRDALEWFDVRGGNSDIAASSHANTSQVGRATSNNIPVTLTIGRNSLNHVLHVLAAIYDLRTITRIEMNCLIDGERRSLLSYLSATEDPNKPSRTMADCLLKKPRANRDVVGVWPFPRLCELVRKELDDDAVYYVLVEPVIGRSGEGATAGTTGRAARWELDIPNTPWKKVV